VPFAGRIHQGRFTWGRESVALPANLAPEPHAIHGQGWQRPWEVLAAGASYARLRLDHAAAEWPWRYRAEQHFQLGADGLALSLSLRNLDTRPMPGGIGWHPYFPRADARLTADVDALWTYDDHLQPTAGALPPALDLRRGRPLAELEADEVFRAGGGGARIGWPDGTLSLSTGGLGGGSPGRGLLGQLVVYAPAGQNFFCVEPISHVPNAVNADLPADLTGLRPLAPGASISARILLSWRPNPAR
jgi:aldose 1-epimerase